MISKKELSESQLTLKPHSYMKEVALIKLPGNGSLALSEAHVCNSSVATIKMQKMQPHLNQKC